jgi:hypothetical protein
MVSLGLLPIGYAIMGPLAESLGAVNVLIGGAALGMLALALGLIPREIRMLERLGESRSAVEREGVRHGQGHGHRS